MSRRPPAQQRQTGRDGRRPDRRPAGGAGATEGAGGAAGEGAEQGVDKPQGSGAAHVGKTEGLDLLLDPMQVAKVLGVSLRLVRRLVNERRIPYVKVGKLVRFEPADVKKYVATCKVESNTSKRHDVGL